MCMQIESQQKKWGSSLTVRDIKSFKRSTPPFICDLAIKYMRCVSAFAEPNNILVANWPNVAKAWYQFRTLCRDDTKQIQTPALFSEQAKLFFLLVHTRDSRTDFISDDDSSQTDIITTQADFCCTDALATILSSSQLITNVSQHFQIASISSWFQRIELLKAKNSLLGVDKIHLRTAHKQL